MRLTNVASLLMALILVFGGPIGSGQTQPERVVFAVWPGQKGKKPDAPILDPIVIVDGEKFRNPMAYLQENDRAKAQAEADSFSKAYLVAGRKYSMLFGGGNKGLITVAEEMGISCENLTATLVPPVPSANGQKALAVTSTNGIGLHENWRKSPSPEQQAAFLKLAAESLMQKGIRAISPTTIRLRNLRATRLGPDRPVTLIGSVTFMEKEAAHNLLLAAEQTDDRWSVTLSSYHVSTDLEDSVDDVQEDFVDQLDLNGKGMDDIVTISGYYESWDYSIYRLEQGAWKKVYHGGGGGC